MRDGRSFFYVSFEVAAHAQVVEKTKHLLSNKYLTAFHFVVKVLRQSPSEKEIRITDVGKI